MRPPNRRIVLAEFANCSSGVGLQDELQLPFNSLCDPAFHQPPGVSTIERRARSALVRLRPDQMDETWSRGIPASTNISTSQLPFLISPFGPRNRRPAGFPHRMAGMMARHIRDALQRFGGLSRLLLRLPRRARAAFQPLRWHRAPRRRSRASPKKVVPAPCSPALALKNGDPKNAPAAAPPPLFSFFFS